VAALGNISELGSDLDRNCFVYPQHVLGRKHGPQGYASYEAYRAWLRDEFSFRCAYCLMRETWLRGSIGFQIDHGVPQAQHPAGALDYFSSPRAAKPSKLSHLPVNLAEVRITSH
jgi:hypothetical protein